MSPGGWACAMPDPAQPLPTAREEPDDLDDLVHDLSEV